MSTNGTNAKVTLLKLGSVLLFVIVVLYGIRMFQDAQNAQNSDSDREVIREATEEHEQSQSKNFDEESLAGCADGSDCDDEDDRENQPNSQKATEPSFVEAEVEAEFAIEEEGIPAVDEKPAKSN